MDNKNILEDKEIMTMTVGFIVGIGILALPRDAVQDANQDGWIATFIGAIYPMIIVLCAAYMCKYFPEDNILVLSQRYLGKIVGTVCNILFMIYFFIHVTTGTTGFTNIFRLYATSFLPPWKIQVTLLSVIIYASSKGIKTLAKINQALFYLICLSMVSISIAFLKGDMINMQPILGSGFKNIFKAAIEAIYPYGGIEQIFLIYPFMKNKKKFKSNAIKGVGIAAFFYTWTTFVSIYFLGYKITSMNLWPVFLVSESIVIPLINNFKTIFLLSWAAIMCAVLTNEYTAAIDILAYNIKAKDKAWLYFITAIILFGVFTRFPNQIYRSDFTSTVMPKYTIYIFMYVGIIVVLMFLDKNKKRKSDE